MKWSVCRVGLDAKVRTMCRTTMRSALGSHCTFAVVQVPESTESAELFVRRAAYARSQGGEFEGQWAVTAYTVWVASELHLTSQVSSYLTASYFLHNSDEPFLRSGGREYPDIRISLEEVGSAGDSVLSVVSTSSIAILHQRSKMGGDAAWEASTSQRSDSVRVAVVR